MSSAAVMGALLAVAAPISPDSDEARELLRRELAGPEYLEAQPNWFDRAAAAVWEWFSGLFEAGVGGPPAVVWVVIAILAVAAIAAAYLIFGPPRLNRRSTAAGSIFDDDGRDSATIRRAADAAADAADWTLAIEESFRALARGLAERAVLESLPGTTARAFAARATEFFPGLVAELGASALAFDEVRYLDRPGSEAAYREVAALEARVRATKPLFAPLATAAASG